jgi:uncharacterized membrane protein YesL
MQAALGVAWETLKDWYNSMVGLAALNMLWIGSVLTVVLAAPATAGLAAVTNSIAHGTGQHFEDFKGGARRYLWISLRWLLVNAIVVGLLALNMAFYGSMESAIAPALQVFVAVLAVVWAAAQLYVWPFLMEQEDKRLRLALRNALFLALGTPVYTLTLLAVVAVVVVVSAVTILPLAVFTASFLSLLGNRAVVERLTAFGKLPSASQSAIDGEQP